jgi:hypothetical protein
LSIAVKLNAQDAPGGHPRRGWLVLGDFGQPNQFYTDEDALRGVYPFLKVLVDIKVSASEYRRFKRECGV